MSPEFSSCLLVNSEHCLHIKVTYATDLLDFRRSNRNIKFPEIPQFLMVLFVKMIWVAVIILHFVFTRRFTFCDYTHPQMV